MTVTRRMWAVHLRWYELLVQGLAPLISWGSDEALLVCTLVAVL